MSDVELFIMVCRSVQFALIIPFIFWVIPLFAREGWYQYLEWHGVHAEEKARHRRITNDTFFSELVEINRGRPRKAPKPRHQA
jgi:hypothetical protein